MTERSGLSPTARGAEDLLRMALTEGFTPEAELSIEQFDALWILATRSRLQLVLGDALLRFLTLIPVERRERVMECLRNAQARELLRCRELRQIVAVFDAAQVPVLLLKGAGLAYTEYSASHLRPACDIDLLIAADTIGPAEAALIALGYERRLEPDVELASGQRHYKRDDGLGGHLVDLHWRISNVRLCAGVLPFADAWRSSVPVPRLGQPARTLGRIDAILLACIHRVVHHYDDPDSLWLWDVHLLCRGMTADEADLIVEHAASQQVCSVVAHSLRRTFEQFGTALPAALVERLAAAGAREAARRFVSRRLRPIDLLRSDLSAGSMRTNLLLLREHLLPPTAYMRQRYPRWPVVFIPVAYLHRVWRGIPKWFAQR